MNELVIDRVGAKASYFSQYHRLRTPQAGGVLRLAPSFDSGAYGSLHGVEADPRVGGGPATVAKMFNETDPASRQRVLDLMGRLHGELQRSPNPDWPALVLALPFALVEGRFEGEVRLIALMLDLRALGYESMTLEGGEREEHQDRDELERLDYAYSFARGARLLESVSFLHADINLKNVMFRKSDADVQVIDFDCGVIVERGDERAQVVGRKDDFVPPEAKRLGSVPVDADALTLEAERWSVGLMVGLLLFGVEPYFFLGQLSAGALDAFAREPGRWPHLDTRSDLFMAQNLPAYEYFMPIFEAAPGDTRELFADFFAAGSTGAARPTAAAWVGALEVARRPPAFEYLRVEPDVQVEGTEVLVSWCAKGAEAVHSKLFGAVEAEGSRTFVVGDTTKFEFEAVNRFGSQQGSTAPVRVVPLPRIDSVPLPAFPGLRATLKVPGAVTLAPPQPPVPARFATAVSLPAPRAISAAALRPGSVPMPKLPSLRVLLSGVWSMLSNEGGR